jgi:putative heme iron utilization protein
MNAELSAQLARLLRARSTAALGTLRAGAPFVSMVPYALAAGGFVVHVSALAAHTRDMLADARVSLMVAQAEDGASSPLGLMRVSVQGLAQQVPADAPELAALKAAYLARFPDAEPMFGFGDFSIFLIRAESARFVAGFGQAHSLTGAALLRLLQQI